MAPKEGKNIGQNTRKKYNWLRIYFCVKPDMVPEILFIFYLV